MENRKNWLIADFWQGVIAGFIATAIIFSFVLWIVISNHNKKEILEYVEKQIEIETLREDYLNRDPVEFLDDIPGVRRAVDHATAEFDRKRDEAIQRIRNRPFD
jgi:hypothetical protein